MRIASRAALRKLAAILSSQGVTCEKLSDVFGSRNVSPHRGDTEDALFEFTNYHAIRGRFNRALLEKIQTDLDTGRQDDFDALAVEMEFIDPPTRLLNDADLKQLKQMAEKARLQDRKRFMALGDKLDVRFKDFAARDNDDREQLRAWFDACNRQIIEAGDSPWIVELTRCASEVCDDTEIRQAFERVRDLCKSKEGPWELSGLLPEPAPPQPGVQRLRRDVAPAPVAEEPAGFPEGPPKAGYALVVGISEYAVAGLTPLKCAAKDAQQVAEYLKTHPDIDFKGERVLTLINRDATLSAILDGLDRLRKDCARPSDVDPLAVVYFSGHGMQDEIRRNFLVPHDGDPRKLFSTALWNRNFNNALEQIGKRRLVVLLDACHAQGMFVPDGAKDGAGFGYDPDDEHEGLHLEPGRGRFFIASCAAGQRSFEGEDNGIFTQALLELLRFESLSLERLDLADLYRNLRKRVDELASSLHAGHSQTPTANFAEDMISTGLILAINRRHDVQLKNFLEAIRKYRSKNANVIRTKDWATIIQFLRDFVLRDERAAELDEEFYSLFVESANKWTGATSATVDDVVSRCWRGLVALYEEHAQTASTNMAVTTGSNSIFAATASATLDSTPHLARSSDRATPAPASAPRTPGTFGPVVDLRAAPNVG